MKESLLREILPRLLVDPSSELCRDCAKWLDSEPSVLAAVFSELIANGGARPDQSLRSPAPTGGHQHEVLDLGRAAQILDKRGRHGTPSRLEISDSSYHLPARGWQFLMLRITEHCLALGLQVPWLFQGRLIVSRSPEGLLANPKRISWKGEALFISTNRSAPDILRICDAMRDCVGLPADSIHVTVSVSDKK